MAKAITAKQAEKIAAINNYLATEIGKPGAMVAENDASFIWNLKKIYANATGVYLGGSEAGGRPFKDRIDFGQIGTLYAAIRRGDDDFKEFLQTPAPAPEAPKAPEAPAPAARKSSPERAQLVFDIFITALEGGVGYWAYSKTYHWRNDDGSDDVTGFYSDIIDAESDDETGEDAGFKPCRIDAAVIKRGISRIMKKDFQVSDAIKKEVTRASFSNDFGDMDADHADCIVQAGLFNEIVFC